MVFKISPEYLHIIKKHYPDATPQKIRTFVGGNDHFVFVVNDEIVFRFPQKAREIHPTRKSFLDRLSKISPITTPTINIHYDKEESIYYETNVFVPGISFYPSVAETFRLDELMGIARQFGKFLTILHAFSLSEARAIGVGEMDSSQFWKYMEQNKHAYPKYKQVVFPHIPHHERIWIEQLFTNYITLIRHTPFPTRVIHSDMWVYHIIVDLEKHTLSGVIDFGPRIADPANDFKAFEYYGSDFVQEVYRYYTLPIDEHFEQRRLFYTGHDEVFELARSLERHDTDKIVFHKRRLSEYIRDHPLS